MVPISDHQSLLGSFRRSTLTAEYTFGRDYLRRIPACGERILPTGPDLVLIGFWNVCINPTRQREFVFALRPGTT